MPAGLPGDSLLTPTANPVVGPAVIMDPLSGPKGSPFDARRITGYVAGMPTYANDGTNLSTGALSTGIGYGPNVVFNPGDTPPFGDNFTDDYIPGQDKPDSTLAADSTYMYIGGGRSLASGLPNPYAVAGVGISAVGNGQVRDSGAGPAFTGTTMRTATAAGAVATGVVVEAAVAGYLNRSNQALVAGNSTFGVAPNTTAPSLVRSDKEVLHEEFDKQREHDEAVLKEHVDRAEQYDRRNK